MIDLNKKRMGLYRATLTNDVNNVPPCMCTYVFHIEIVWK